MRSLPVASSTVRSTSLLVLPNRSSWLRLGAVSAGSVGEAAGAFAAPDPGSPSVLFLPRSTAAS